MKRWQKVLLVFVVAAALAAAALLRAAGPKAARVEYGVTFSAPYAAFLGLPWQDVYTAMLDDLKVRKVRIPVYWNAVQPEPNRYRFEDLDWQLEQARLRGAQVVLVVGRRVPRWPECHEPGWLKELSSEGAPERALLAFLETVVGRYAVHPAVSAWQVENEPFLDAFGQCPDANPDLLDREIALVKRLDPSRPVVVTESGELSSWTRAGGRGDVFGTTFYRYVYSDVFNRYWTNHLPAWLYRLKGGWVRVRQPTKPIWVVELEAEPWTTLGVLKTPVEEQFKTMSLENFKTIVEVSRQTGYSPQYLWGVEWWYWVRQQNHPEFWEEARKLFVEQP